MRGAALLRSLQRKPSRLAELRFRDIADNMDAIPEFTKNMEFDQFLSDDRTRLAVKRGLLIISEVARKLGSEAKADVLKFHGIECVPWETGCGTTETE